LVHIDPVQTIAMPLLLWHTCGLVFGGAKPVPINPLAFRRPAEGKMLTAIAGPITNFLFALILAACYAVTSLIAVAADVPNSLADAVLPFGIRINIILACFNMIPIPPLDGSRLVAYLLPRPLAFTYERLEPVGIILLIAILISAPVVLSPIYYAMDFASDLLIEGSRFIAEAAWKITRG
ncbi:MAG: site-2 protease family protein, partial [Planctomycetota bacterium]|nr:site-2 protease family protein [Planctomycetota bacterium]